MVENSWRHEAYTILQTVVCGVIAYVGLPNSPATAAYLTEEEREWAVQRLELKGSSAERCVTRRPFSTLNEFWLTRRQRETRGFQLG